MIAANYYRGITQEKGERHTKLCVHYSTMMNKLK